ncbi:ARF guanine-nucleotide exchange factor GNOM-like [Salvia miltiorrhiza]|uniref:ARF guanine-nucleotide exchange factor GNOM-like n=1 Tax=Salvia miltiorrhiza TaxID=226208 RepID=UPI0025ABE08B|nr:ARF guanine-nucleotide exchange factor GNOM-like [Salvia miltiorrhiza]XP_057769560.1 ARF guanine-nucleotide exchange factor GNOM-like [Salvia miltiorrhiza]
MTSLLNQENEVNGLVEQPNCSFKLSGGALACMVNSEIGAVLAVMRRNVRWGVQYASDDDQIEHSLIKSFKELRKKIFSWQNHWHTIDPVLYLQPFLEVIKSDETGAPITGVALSSVYKILNLQILDSETVNVDNALHLIVDAVTSCRFEVTDPASEEVVLMKILQVLLACMKSKASVNLNNHHVCSIVNTCFRIVHQASSKSELLQRISRHTMHELVRCIFLHLPDLEGRKNQLPCGEKSSLNIEDNAAVQSPTSEGKPKTEVCIPAESENEKIESSRGNDGTLKDDSSMMDPYGVPSMVEIFHFLCSLLNVMENIEMGPRSNPIAYHEDVPLFALGLINSAIELGGASFGNHPKLLALIQEELFYNLMQFGLSMSPLILSTVCSIVLNLYHHLRTKLKLQLEAFISNVLLRIAQSKHGASYQLQEVAMEALIDFCRQPMFVTELYANYDCDISCGNVFEGLANLLSRSAFPVNSPLSAMNTLALDGLIALVQGMAERIEHDSSSLGQAIPELEEYSSFWILRCDDYGEPLHWVPFVHSMKNIKRKLMTGVDHFNRDPKKGLEFLQGLKLLPDKLDARSVAFFFRYTVGLDKNLIGEFLGSHDEFCIQVLHEFARIFDFRNMNLDTALRVFLETFRLPGESQKIQRVLEAFSESYYEQSSNILVNKDAALLLSYSLILLNTDQHNAQVKKKMSEEDFIRNNRKINGGNDLPRDFLSELYHSICENEIRMVPDQGGSAAVLTRSHWIGLTHRAKHTSPYIVSDSGSHLDYDMFAILSGPAIAAISVVLDHAEDEDVSQSCIDGFLAIAKLSASYNLGEVLDDLVISLCKFTTLLSPSFNEKSILYFADDIKAKMATVAVFTIANRYSDSIRSGWRNILDCILSLHKIGLLPARLASDATDELESSTDNGQVKTSATYSPVAQVPATIPRKSSGLMSRFSLLLSLDAEEPAPQPSEEQLAARQRTLQTIQNCHIDSIFAESKFLQAESLSQLVRALVMSAGRPLKGNSSSEDEDTAVFCLELLIAITLNNRDRIMLLWQNVYEHIANVVQSTVMPCTLVEKAVFGLLRICQRLLPYKENLTDELLKSLQLVLKLDARVADAYCEQITQEVMHLVKANAMQIRSHMGWRTIISLVSITARHPEAAESGFETLSYIMSEGAHLSPANYVLCVNAARQFAESRVGNVDRSVKSLDLMSGSVVCLVTWFYQTKEAVGEETAVKMSQDILEMWMRLVQGLRKVCVDQREEVRNHAIVLLQRCLTGVDGISIPTELWLQCFDLVIFTLLDELPEMAQQQSAKEYRSMEGSMILSLKLLSKAFLQALIDLSQTTSFCQLWLKVLGCMEKHMKLRFRGKRSEKIHELVPELLKNTLLVMKTNGILVPCDPVGGDSFWQLTWLHVNNIAPSLQLEVFPSEEVEKLKENHAKANCSPLPDGSVLVPPNETAA